MKALEEIKDEIITDVEKAFSISEPIVKSNGEVYSVRWRTPTFDRNFDWSKYSELVRAACSMIHFEGAFETPKWVRDGNGLEIFLNSLKDSLIKIIAKKLWTEQQI